MNYEEMAKKTVNWRLKYKGESIIDTRDSDGKDMMEILNHLGQATTEQKREFHRHMADYTSTLSKQQQDAIKRMDIKAYREQRNRKV